MLFILILPSLLLIFLAVYKVRGRKNTVQPITSKPDYSSILIKKVQFYRELDEQEKALFVRKVHSFLQHTGIEGIGTSVDETDRVLVAASAIIPIFRFGNWTYRNITNVILYPDTFNESYDFEGGERSILGMVGTGFMNGQMILSKTALHNGFREPGGEKNTAIHEFVHLLDGADGSIDGVPELLLTNASVIPWVKAMESEVRRIEKGRSDINPYAITNEAEFFAVVSEYFFEKPSKFKEKHPALYELMDKMFNPENNA